MIVCVSETNQLWKPGENPSFLHSPRLTAKLPVRDPSLGQNSFQAESKTQGILVHTCPARKALQQRCFKELHQGLRRSLLFSIRRESQPTERVPSSPGSEQGKSLEMSLDSVSMATVSLYGVQSWGSFIIETKRTSRLSTTDLLRQLHC